MKTASLEKAIYFQDYVVIEPGDTPLKAQQLLSEDEYRQNRQKYGNSFVAIYIFVSSATHACAKSSVITYSP